MTIATPLKVLIVEDRDSETRQILNELQSAGFDPVCTRVHTEADYVTGVAAQPAVILFDYNLPQLDAMHALKLLRDQGCDIPFIIVSANTGEHIAVRAIQEGAADYLLKEHLGLLGMAVHRALIQKRLRDAKQLANASLDEQLRLAELIAEIGWAQTSTESLPAILQRCAESLVRNLRANLVRIWTVDELHNVLKPQASASDSTVDEGPFEFVAFGQLCEQVALDDQTAGRTTDLTTDSAIHNADWISRERLTSYASFPLIVDGRVAGKLAIFGRRAFRGAVFEAMETVANHIAVGIQRKRSEELLQLTESRLQQLVSTTPAVFYVLRIEDGNCIPTWVSQSIERLTGYEEPLVLEPEWWLNNIHPEDREHAAVFLPTLLSQMSFATEYRFRCLNGEYRWLLDQKRLLLDVTGKPVEVIGSWLDITERKLLTEQYRKAQKLEAVGRLAGSVAHDFNNLLTVIIGYGELMLETLHPQDPLRVNADEICRAGMFGASLTRQLLAYSRRQFLIPVVLDLNELLTDMHNMIGRLIGEDIDLLVRAAPDLWHVRGDPGQMEQVVMNLVVNARDAMPDGGKLTIEADNVVLDESHLHGRIHVPNGDYVRICVSDSGVGMDPATRARIFEPFFTTKGVNQGTGLGLPTVDGIVAQSGGFVDISSEPGEGTTFRIFIPRDFGSMPRKKAPAELQATAVGTETVLLVEDSEAVRCLARLALERAGYRVLEAENPRAAIQLLGNFSDPLHILVTDVVMPGMSGRQFAELTLRTRPEMKVLYISGYTDEAVIQNGILEHGTPFLQKPFSPNRLTQKVREVLDQNQ